MKKSNFLLGTVSVFGLLLVGAGCSFNNTTNTSVNTPPTPTPTIQTETMMVESATNTEADMVDTFAEVEMQTDLVPDAEVIPSTQEEQKGLPGSYEEYSPEKVAFASQGDVVLFFHAPWCPTCKAVDADINGELALIPANTKILKVDYDSSTDLKKKYGVTYQHTFVQVDAQGNMIQKWSGGNTLESILKKIQ